MAGGSTSSSVHWLQTWLAMLFSAAELAGWQQLCTTYHQVETPERQTVQSVVARTSQPRHKLRTCRSGVARWEKAGCSSWGGGPLCATCSICVVLAWCDAWGCLQGHWCDAPPCCTQQALDVFQVLWMGLNLFVWQWMDGGGRWPWLYFIAWAALMGRVRARAVSYVLAGGERRTGLAPILYCRTDCLHLKGFWGLHSRTRLG